MRNKKYEISDSDLIKDYKSGSDKAFRTLVERHQDKVFTTVLLIVKDRYIAEDITQETFIKAIKTINSEKYKERGKFLSWVSMIAHNKAIDYFRRQKRYPFVTTEDGNSIFETMEFSDASVESITMKHESQKMMRHEIEKLPEAQREVLIMRHFMQMSFQEIADTTGVSLNTALGRMRYALQNLRKSMSFTKDEAFQGNPY